MKKLLFIIAIFISTTSFTIPHEAIEKLVEQKEVNLYSEYSKGWSDGYKEGWCYETDYGCIHPIVPICPIRRIGEKGYRDGYNRGFTQGVRDKRND
jgi:hypothetical protein